MTAPVETQPAEGNGVADLLQRVVILQKTNGQFVIGRLVEMAEAYLGLFEPRYIHQMQDAQSRRVFTALSPYYPPFVATPDREVVPVSTDVVENIFHPQPEMEAEWVKATSGILQVVPR
jgi:hypothetical protein